MLSLATASVTQPRGQTAQVVQNIIWKPSHRGFMLVTACGPEGCGGSSNLYLIALGHRKDR
jgi:hypothetical protein